MQEKRQTSPRTSISHFSSRVKLSEAERFRRRNRIDADLQAYADQFVDVSDIESLPTHVAHAALQDGVRLVGDQEEITRVQTARRCRGMTQAQANRTKNGENLSIGLLVVTSR